MEMTCWPVIIRGIMLAKLHFNGSHYRFVAYQTGWNTTLDIHVISEEQFYYIHLPSPPANVTPGIFWKFAAPGTKQQPRIQSSVDAITASISEFVFDGLSGVTFESWFQKYEDIFRVELANQDDSWKVRLLLRKLGAVEHERYSNFVLPKNPREFSFDETVRTLTQIFGEQASLFSIRYNCLKLTKCDSHDFVTHAGIVNKECERFRLATMTPDQMKSLVFVCRLQSHSDADIRTRILHKLEQEPNLTLQAITDECQRLIHLKHDTRMIETPGHQEDPQVCRTMVKHTNSHDVARNQKPPNACSQCGEWHFSRFRPFKSHQYQNCKKIGHKESHCRPDRKPIRVRSTPSYKQHRPNRFRRPWSNTKAILAAFRTDFNSCRKYVAVTVNDVLLKL
ncbi:hypothetical protein T265_11641 [Opisthorchis viverrini]|uniref:DUF7083 domain-containing protein n=1 Tax=Opisthorchis viverrini TaxID=6198 RepID=A0A074ZWV3_OPIVI|nr:hypothetical protein T265_11641 [Opisthorchis viverrini]KER19644.1 hypothetical protein T265_11641 [Opisthorchis viverrini]